MKYELSVRDYNVPNEEHIERQKAHMDAARSLATSIRDYNINNLKNYKCICKLPNLIPLNSNPKWSKRLFGAVNTVQKAGCLVFVSKLFLDEFDFNYIEVNSIIKEIEEKHYRLWKLANRDKTLSMPTISLEELKAEFPDDEPIQSCNSLDEVYSVAGNPVGIGGSMFFLDNLIYLVCRWNDIDVVKPYSGSSYGTRIYNVDSLLENLEMGCPIPLRVENSVYLNDSSLKGGHYITLYGFNSGTAIVVDSNIDSNAGIKELPIKQLFDAMIANPNLVCAWNPSTVLLRK